MRSVLHSALAALLLTSSAVHAQGWTTTGGATVPTEGRGARLASSADDVTAVLQALLEERCAEGAPGVGLAVRRDGRLLFAGAAGMADLELGVPCSPSTRFDLASIAKSVTAAAVMRLAEEGALDLEDPVRELLPELDEAFAEVRVRHLVHHTAGVEDVTGLLAMAGWRASDPVGLEDQVAILLRQRHLRFPPGGMHLYSNGGYVLLAEIVARVTGEPLPDWARANLFEPLGLESASLAGRIGEPVRDLATPYSGPAGARVRHPATAACGAGGFLASPRDLARWGEELATGATFGAAFGTRMRTTGRLEDGSPLDYASGIARGNVAGHPCYQHSGSEIGGQSAFVFLLDQDLVVAAATNDGDGPSPYALIEDVVRILAGETTAQPTPDAGRSTFIPADQEVPEASRGVQVDSSVLQRYVGTYVMEEGPELVFAADGDRLLLGFAGEPTIRVFPLPNGRFVLPPVNYEYSFDPEKGTATMHVTERSVRRGEPRDIVGRRFTPAPLGERERRAILGTYTSDELGSYYEIAADEGGLVLVHPRHGRLPLRPLSPGVYTLPGHDLARLALVREGEAVTGFDLTAFSWGAGARFRRLVPADQGVKR